jgi:hypothetical protein
MMEVEVDEDCTRTVTRMPIMTPTIGLESWGRFDETVSAEIHG